MKIRMMPVAKDGMTNEQQRIYEAIVAGPRGHAGGIFMTWLRSPGMADPAQQLGEFLRFNSSLPLRLSELAILVTARHWTSQFEWHAHAGIAAGAGLPPTAIEDIRQRRPPTALRDDEQVVYAFCESVYRNGRVADDVYADAVRELGEAGVVELIGILGYYTLVALSFNVLGDPLPDGLPAPLPV